MSNYLRKMLRFVFKILLKQIKKDGQFIVYKEGDYATVNYDGDYNWILEHFSGTVYKEDVLSIFTELAEELDISIRYRCDNCWSVFESELDLENYGGLGKWCSKCREV